MFSWTPTTDNGLDLLMSFLNFICVRHMFYVVVIPLCCLQLYFESHCPTRHLCCARTVSLISYANANCQTAFNIWHFSSTRNCCSKQLDTKQQNSNICHVHYLTLCIRITINILTHLSFSCHTSNALYKTRHIYPKQACRKWQINSTVAEFRLSIYLLFWNFANELLNKRTRCKEL